MLQLQIEEGKLNNIGSVAGIPIRGAIRKVDLSLGLAYVSLPLSQSSGLYPVKIPAGWIGPNGQISAGYPETGTNIFVILGQGNEWMFIGYDQPDTGGSYNVDGIRLINNANKLKKGRWVTLVDNDVNLIVDPTIGVLEGDSIQFIQSDPNLGIFSSRFNQEMHFTEAHRNITGPILRDIKSNSSRDISGSSLSGHEYNKDLDYIGLDPKTTPAISGNRNPALAESRSIYYEFINSFGYTNDKDEERIYAKEDLPTTKPYQRKRSRTDSVSLSLDHPNFLLETIIGTIVDIYGNILDINRNILPSGIIDALSFRKSEEDSDVVFAKLREQLRKSIAYHFELNARKQDNSILSQLSETPGLYTPDYTDTQNYSRNRSRFFIDIDKEGQFKVNVPSSSEVGNIPLLVRGENFSNLKGAEEGADRGQFLRNSTDNTDIKLEPHGVGVISLVSNENTLKSYSAPKNRFDGEPIKLGTGFHDISNTLFLHKFEEPYRVNGGYPDSLINFIDPVTKVVSSEIIVSGKDANAGGRSGTISLDGFISISIGANTVDRQSMWLDCAGGIVAAIGRDKYQRSVSTTLDGDLYMQVGGPTITSDSRFINEPNTPRDGVVDIRIWNSGSFQTIRIDSQGIKIHSPQRIDIVSEGEMRLKSVNSSVTIDAENIYFYSKEKGTSRLVLRSTEGAAGRTI